MSLRTCAPPTPCTPHQHAFQELARAKGTVCSHGIPQTGFRKPKAFHPGSSLLKPIMRTVTGTQGSNGGAHSPAPRCQRGLQAPSQPWVPQRCWDRASEQQSQSRKGSGAENILESPHRTLWGHPLVTAPAEPLGTRAGRSQTQLPILGGGGRGQWDESHAVPSTSVDPLPKLRG